MTELTVLDSNCNWSFLPSRGKAGYCSRNTLKRVNQYYFPLISTKSVEKGIKALSSSDKTHNTQTRKSSCGNRTRRTARSVTCRGREYSSPGCGGGGGRYCSLGGIQSWPEGCPISAGGGTPVLAGGTLVLARGYPVPAGGWWDTPVLGYPQPELGYPQKGPGTRDLEKNLGLGYPLEKTWDQRPGKEPGTGVPPGKDLGQETWERTWNWGTPRKDLGPETCRRTWDWGTPIGCRWTKF